MTNETEGSTVLPCIFHDGSLYINSDRLGKKSRQNNNNNNLPFEDWENGSRDAVVSLKESARARRDFSTDSPNPYNLCWPLRKAHIANTQLSDLTELGRLRTLLCKFSLSANLDDLCVIFCTLLFRWRIRFVHPRLPMDGRLGRERRRWWWRNDLTGEIRNWPRYSTQ